MTLEELKQVFFSSLKKIYVKDEIDAIFSVYLEDKLSTKYIPTLDIKTDLTQICEDIKSLERGKPIQYITKKCFFYNNFFTVNEHTLIPRPETEELIELIEDDHDKNNSLSIIDLGTGSGCIAISLQILFPNANVYALDASKKALDISKKNAQNLECNNITFFKENLLGNFQLNKSFDIIVSNPPYIRKLEKDKMHKNVLDFEPHFALFVENDDPLIFYKRIIKFAENHLNENGSIYCEINQYLANETKELFKKHFNNVILIKDISNNYRIIKVS